jgi:hypothetical protein
MSPAGLPDNLQICNYFCKVVKEFVPDKMAIREALKNEGKIDGAKLITSYNLQIK